jgi:hypothetical protein
MKRTLYILILLTILITPTVKADDRITIKGDYMSSDKVYSKNNIRIYPSSEYLISESDVFSNELTITNYSPLSEIYLKNITTGEVEEISIIDLYEFDYDVPTSTLKLGTKEKQITYNQYESNTEMYPVSSSIYGKVEASDEGSGIKGLYYLISDKKLTQLELDKINTWKKTTGEFEYSPEKTTYIYAKVIDNVGNYTYLGTNPLLPYKLPTIKNKTLSYSASINQIPSIEINLNGNTIDKINIDNKEISKDNYKITNNILEINKEYLDKLTPNKYTIKIEYLPKGETNLKNKPTPIEVSLSIGNNITSSVKNTKSTNKLVIIGIAVFFILIIIYIISHKKRKASSQ